MSSLTARRPRPAYPRRDKLEGKTILTVEGLSDWEKAVYTYAFRQGRRGAVRLLASRAWSSPPKALLDANPAPTREEAAFAIRNNICRCTGYVKIIDGILLAAEIPSAPAKLPEEKKTGYGVGERAVRVDVAEKVQGLRQVSGRPVCGRYALRRRRAQQIPRARVLAIHKEKAEALPGVVGVYTAEDIPGRSRSAICSRTGTR